MSKAFPGQFEVARSASTASSATPRDAASFLAWPGDGRALDDRDLEALFRQPDAVSALAVSDGERPPARPQAMCLGPEKHVWFGAEEIVLACEAGVPVRAVGNGYSSESAQPHAGMSRGS